MVLYSFLTQGNVMAEMLQMEARSGGRAWPSPVGGWVAVVESTPRLTSLLVLDLAFA